MTNFHKSRIKNSLVNIGMKWWWWFLTVFLIAVIQTTFLKHFEIDGVTPNILIILAVIAIIFYNFEQIWIYLLFIGLILDFFSDSWIGINLLALAVTALVFNFIKIFFNRRNALTCIFLGFFELLFFYSLSIGFNFIFMKLNSLLNANFIHSSLIFLCIGVFYNFLIFIPALFLWRFKFNVK